MSQRDTIKSLRTAIAFWYKSAEEHLRQAEQSRDEAMRVKEDFEKTVTMLEKRTCPFCSGEMIDTTPLKVLGGELATERQFLHQGEVFGLSCQSCQTYETHPARESAQSWTPENISSQSKIFATEVFQHLPHVDEVCLEKAVGRGWLFRIGKEWFANELDKAQIKQQWGMYET